MKIAVIGAGAVGGYFGGRLAQAGEDVTFIARGNTLRALQADGLRVESLKGDFTIHPAQVTDDPAAIGPADAVLVAVKTWQLRSVAESIRPLIGPDTAVVPLQNGVDAAEQLASVLGDGAVLGGLCRILSYIVEPGHIRHAGAEPYIAFAELDGRPSARVDRLRDAFDRAGVSVESPDDIRAALWEKLLFVSPWGAIGAATRATIGELRGQPETRAMLEQAMAEIWAVARARGVAVAADAVARMMAAMDQQLPEGTASMQRDIMEGRPSELEAQAGIVVRLGEASGVPTPLYRFLYHTLLPQERRAR